MNRKRDHEDFILSFTGNSGEGRRKHVEALVECLKGVEHASSIDELAAKLDIAREIDPHAVQGWDVPGAVRAAYLRRADWYLKILDLDNIKEDDEHLILRRFQPGMEFESFYFRLGQLRLLMGRAGVESILPPPANTKEAMEEAIEQKLRNVHLSRAQRWYEALQTSSIDNPLVEESDMMRVNPQQALLRLQYHLQQSGRSYEALSSEKKENAADVVKEINLLAGIVWSKRYMDVIDRPPKLMSAPVVLDENGMYQGVYVFLAETDIALCQARFQCANVNSDITINAIKSAMDGTGLSLSELFAESGYSDEQMWHFLHDRLVERELYHCHGYDRPETMNAFEKAQAAEQCGIEKSLKRHGLYKLRPPGMG